MLVQQIHNEVELNQFELKYKYKYKVEVIPSASKPVAISSQQAFLACLFLKVWVCLVIQQWVLPYIF